MSETPDSHPDPEVIQAALEINRRRNEMISRARFQTWLLELDDTQLSALVANWENIMDDAALDRVDSWVIAGEAIADLRSRQ